MNILRSLGVLFRRSRLEREMQDEMRAHLDEQTRRNLAAGMNEKDARAAAMRQFGGVAQIQERAREGRSFGWMEDLVRDAGFAVRTLRQSPAFTSVVVLTLAVGIGVNTALFTWFNAAVFRPLPVRQPEQLVAVKRLDAAGRETSAMSYPDYLAYREHQTVFTGFAASTRRNVGLLDADGFGTTAKEMPSRLRVEMVSTNYLSTFDVPMALGRSLVAADETSAGALPVIVLSHRSWQSMFAGNPEVIGRTLRVSGLASEALTIVGVTRPEFCGTTPNAPFGWVPLLMSPGKDWLADLNATGLELTGRLRPGVSREQAAEELTVIANELLVRPHPGPTRRETIILARASTYLNLTAKNLEVLLPMVCLFGAVLLISCANASNLILARTVTRQFEFAVRCALGAGRRRLFALLMSESLVLGALGGIVGWVVSAVLLRFAWPWLLDMLPGAREGTAGLQLHADHRVFFFTLAVSILSGAVGGLWPALRMSRRDVAPALNREGSPFGRKIRVSRVRSGLAVTQLALSSALVFIAGLFVHQALKTQFGDVGFDRSRLLTLEVLAPQTDEPGQLDSARRQALEHIRALPAVAAISELPAFPFRRLTAEITIPAADASTGRSVHVIHTAVPADFFATLQLPLVRGRSFLAHEAPSDRVAVISATAARTFWPGQDALGQKLYVPAVLLGEDEAAAAGPPGGTEAERVSVTVVGVARDTPVYEPWFGDQPVVYLPLPPLLDAASHLLIRTDEAIESSLAALQDVGREVTGITPRIVTVDDLFAEIFIQYRVLACAAGMLAALALFVAVIGLYGVMTFTVNQRVREIGIRMALGATPRRVATGIVLESLRIVTVGATAGYGLSLLIATVARLLMTGVGAFDPLSAGVVVLLLATIGLFACWLPARRAARVDPIIALRAE